MSRIRVGYWPLIEMSLPRNPVDRAKAFKDVEVQLREALKAALDPSWKTDNPEEYEAVLKYINKPDRWQGHNGFAKCKVCGRKNGNRDHFRDGFMYPQGYTHYLTDHGIKPPPEMIAAALES